MEEKSDVFEDDRQKSAAYDFTGIFSVQKDKNNYTNCILLNAKILHNLMSRFSIDVTDMDIQCQQLYIVDDFMDPA